jgi:ADP-ribose pyrophosphatase YjhB (NUDIX family)
MRNELVACLRRQPPRAEESITWQPSGLRFRVASYLTSKLPPLQYVTSVRCVALQDKCVLVLRDPMGTYALPGGRREEEEELEVTLWREVLEETGWEIADARLIGFMHFHHLTPRPAGYRYPYPDFIQLVYRATAADFRPGARHPQDADLAVAVASVPDALTCLSRGQGIFIETALNDTGDESGPRCELADEGGADRSIDGDRERSAAFADDPPLSG